MHDLFERVVPWELKFLLYHCVEPEYFIITEVNNTIAHFLTFQKTHLLKLTLQLDDPQIPVKSDNQQII